MFNLFSLDRKKVLITGASRGLGRAMAIGLAQAGAFVLCSGSRQVGCEQTIDQINKSGGKAIDIHADLGDRAEVKRLYTEAEAAVGQIDILVNNGGTVSRFAAEKFPMEEWDRVMEINLNAAFILSQIAGRNMINQGGGKIINIASILSFSGGITVPSYTASKHALAGITKALANEWARHNIQVNAIAPGYFRTDITQQLQDDPLRNAEITKRIPAGRWGDPKDLVGAVVFLASQASNYVNGAILQVDGGWMAR